MFDIIIIKWK